jgi:diguanylate cyclase (GGDEF)-like protein
VTWASDDPIPHSPYYVPRVFGWILETGDAVVVPDVAKRRWSEVSTATLEDVVRGLVAVPITNPERQIIGSICVFDVKPLTIGESEISALKALGHSPAIGAGTRAATPAETALPAARHEEARTEAPVAAAPSAPPHVSTVDSRERRADDAPPLVWPTALLDRNSGHFAVARELARARREERPLSLVLFAVTTSTPQGNETDDTLAAVSETLLKTVRESDVPVQWTADELLLALPGLAAADARLVAERVRAALQAGARYRASVSAGVVEMRAEDTVASVIVRATERVAEARDRGHNRVA